jgi:hypothetical protein
MAVRVLEKNNSIGRRKGAGVCEFESLVELVSLWANVLSFTGRPVTKTWAGRNNVKLTPFVLSSVITHRCLEHNSITCISESTPSHHSPEFRIALPAVLFVMNSQHTPISRQCVCRYAWIIHPLNPFRTRISVRGQNSFQVTPLCPISNLNREMADLRVVRMHGELQDPDIPKHLAPVEPTNHQ